MKVKVTAQPRQGFPGFGAIGRYFQSAQPEVVEVSDAQYKELVSEPASFFLKAEKMPANAKVGPVDAGDGDEDAA